MFRAPLFEEKKEKSYVAGLVAFPFSPRENRNRGRDPINQNFREFRSNRKSFEKTGPPFEVVHFSRSDRLEFWLNVSRPWPELCSRQI